MYRETPSNADLLPMVQEEPPEVTQSARIKSIAGFVSKNNRHYHRVEFADGSSVTIFDSELVKTIHPNMDVDYTIVKNEKSGYWDLKAISGAKPKENPSGEKPSAATRVVSDRGRERFLDDRERSMRSMNGLTNATTPRRPPSPCGVAASKDSRLLTPDLNPFPPLRCLLTTPTSSPTSPSA